MRSSKVPEILASFVKELRNKTGAGMMDCKKALIETNGNQEEAIDWLRKKGISGAEKKSTRVAVDGLIGVAMGKNSAAIVEVNTETDFVSRNEDFQYFVKNVASLALEKVTSLEDLSNTQFDKSGKNVNENLTELIGKIGENIVLRRTEVIRSEEDTLFSSYVHAQIKPGLGKIGVILAFKCEKVRDAAIQLGKNISMHIAAAKPLALDINSVDKSLVEREKKILFEQVKESGKPENIIDKIVTGRILKFYSEIVLLEQVWVIDGETKLSKIIKNFETEFGCSFIIQDFKYFILGEGIELEK